MIKKPKIAILLAAPDGNFVRVDRRNAECVIRAGGIPIHMTPESINEQMDAVRPDGVILPGGDFPIPSKYYADKSAYETTQPERAAAYFSMIEWSKANGVCLLGICAGMQILAASLGGKITSKISSHRMGEGDSHMVEVASKSLLCKIAGDDRFSVNTKHNEAVCAFSGRDFIVSAWNPKDEVIEAIEPVDPWSDFVLGVQWHPEQTAAQDFVSQKIFNALVEKSYKKL